MRTHSPGHIPVYCVTGYPVSSLFAHSCVPWSYRCYLGMTVFSVHSVTWHPTEITFFSPTMKALLFRALSSASQCLLLSLKVKPYLVHLGPFNLFLYSTVCLSLYLLLSPPPPTSITTFVVHTCLPSVMWYRYLLYFKSNLDSYQVELSACRLPVLLIHSESPLLHSNLKVDTYNL